MTEELRVLEETFTDSAQVSKETENAEEIENIEATDNQQRRDFLIGEIKNKESEINALFIEIEDSKEINDEQLETELSAKESEIKAVDEEIKNLISQNDSVSHTTYYQLISELGTERVQLNDKISELESQLIIKSADSETLEIVAHKDGYLHYLSPIKVGIGIQAFQTIAQIDNNEEASLMVESYISAQDISKVKLGDSVKIALDGVNQTKFGTLKGKVAEISHGTIAQQGDNNSQVMLYRVDIELNTLELKHEDDIVKAKPSMPVTAKIIYEKESYLEWILNQLNFTK